MRRAFWMVAKKNIYFENIFFYRLHDDFTNCVENANPNQQQSLL